LQISFGDCLAHVFYTITTLISIDIIGLPSEINNSRLFLLASRISKVLAWRMAAPAVFDHDSRSAIQHPGNQRGNHQIGFENNNRSSRLIEPSVYHRHAFLLQLIQMA